MGRKRAESVDSTTVLDKKGKEKKKAFAVIQKYAKGDLGAAMTPDLNYTIKRLVRGLTSDSSSTKKGFFYASTQVYARFANQIDCQMLLKHIREIC